MEEKTRKARIVPLWQIRNRIISYRANARLYGWRKYIMKKWNLVVGNKPKAKVLSVLLAVTMSFSLFGCGQTASDKANSEASAAASEVEEEAKDAASETVTNPSHSSESGKDETVYIVTDASGNPTNITVNDQLKNKDGKASLVDKTDLKDIVNVNGDGSYKENDDGTITWETGSADVYYQGTTDKTLPVTVSLSYQLDGKDIRPEDLAGKSGHVKIRFDYKNTATVREKVGDKEEDVTVPFAMISGAILPMNKFTNVSVTNGKIMGDGQNNIVVGMAFPGLKDALDWENLKEDAKDDEARKKLDDVDIPEYVEIEADVKDFSLDMTMTMASSNILSDFSDVDDIDVSGITDKMNELQDGTDELEDGAKQLKDGTSDLKDGVSELADGTSDMKDGTSDLKDGASKLKDGTSDLKDGASDLKDGTSKLKDGASTLKSGMQKLADGAATLKNGSSTLSTGTDDLKAGTGQLKSGAQAVSTGAGNLSGGLNKLASATSGLDSTSAATMKSGLTSLVAGLYKVQAGVMTAAGAISDGNEDTSSTTLIGGLKAMSKLSEANETEAGRANTNLDNVISYLNAHPEQDITLADILSARNGLCKQYQTMLGQLQNWGYYNPDNASISTPDVSSLGKTLTEKTSAYQTAASAYADAYATYKAAEAMSSNAATASYHAARAKAAPFLLDDEDTESEDESSENAYSEAASAGKETSSNTDGSASTGSTDGSGAGDSSDTAGNGATVSSETASTASTVSSETASTASTVSSETASTASTVSSETASTASTVSSETTNTASEDGSSSSQEQSTEEGGLIEQTFSQVESQEITSTDVDALKQASDAAYSAMTKAATAMAEAQTAYTNAMAAKTIIDQKPDSLKANIDTFNKILADKVEIPEKQKYSVYPPTTGESSDTTGTTVPSGTDGTASVTYGNALDSALSAKESVGAIKVNEGILLQSETTEIASLKSLYQTLNAVAGPDGQIEKELNKNKSMLSNASNMIDSLPTLSSGIQSAAAGASQLSAGAQSLASGAAGADAGAAKLQAGAKELDTGAGTLKSGIDSANSGVGSLYDGTVSLDDGAGSLYNGTVSLDDGAGSLYDGASKLDDGAQDLYDGAMQLLDGSGDLDDGTQDLLDGIIKLNDEGIKKLTELFGDNVQDAVDRIKAVRNAGSDYQTFTEVAPTEDKDAVNTVKFVYRTAAVKAE
jgi:X-X-X-Leu-X-X-Gly heptad repeat protein